MEKIHGAEITRTEREDIIQIIKGCGGRTNNPLPGYKSIINIKDYKYGEHTLKVAILSEKGESIREQTIKVNFDNKIRGRMCIDTPQTMVEGNTLNISGWAMSTDANATIKVYINGQDMNAKITRTKREDILQIIKRCGGRTNNPLPGYNAQINISKYNKGVEYKIKVVLLSEDGDEIRSEEKNVKFYSNDRGELCLDTPQRTVFTGDSIIFTGWEMSQLENSTLEFYADNNRIYPEIIRTKRADVIAAKPQFGGTDVNPNPGYEATFSIKNLSQGMHTIRVELHSKEGKLLDKLNKNISVVKKIYFGIDVSRWQEDVDWNRVKQEGVNYSIVRIGYGWENLEKNKDAYFEANYASCVRNGIPIGVYTYSYARNVNEAIQEAKAVLHWLNGRKIDLPVFYDVEDDSQKSVDKATMTAMIDAFCTTIKNGGYNAGIYSYKNWLSERIDMSQLQYKYDVWVAQYNNECTYNGRYDIWQYTSENYISGIKGKVDCNWFYKKY